MRLTAGACLCDGVVKGDVLLLGVRPERVSGEAGSVCVLHLYTSFFKCWVFFQLKSLPVMRGIDFTV